MAILSSGQGPEANGATENVCVFANVCTYNSNKLCVFLRFDCCVSAPMCTNWTCQEMSFVYRKRVCAHCACIHLWKWVYVCQTVI